ncbi:MAG: hypothetical protein JW929_15195 [Anaerolineales bacterium]|nr:hypothetical protein [Anaerolineales bacterium]
MLAIADAVTSFLIVSKEIGAEANSVLRTAAGGMDFWKYGLVNGVVTLLMTLVFSAGVVFSRPIENLQLGNWAL